MVAATAAFSLSLSVTQSRQIAPTVCLCVCEKEGPKKVYWLAGCFCRHYTFSSCLVSSLRLVPRYRVLWSCVAAAAAATTTTTLYWRRSHSSTGRVHRFVPLSLFLFSFCLYARVCVSVRLYTVHCGKQELDEMECGRGEMVLPPVHWLLLLLLCTSLHFFSLQVLHCIIFASSALRERERESLCPQGQGSSLRESGEKGASCLQLLIFGGDASRLGECVQRC